MQWIIDGYRPFRPNLAEEFAEQLLRWKEDAYLKGMQEACDEMDKTTGEPWMRASEKWSALNKALENLRSPNSVINKPSSD
ncbi:MAG: hypothetical protein IT576_02110 [Verrucomicrobiales bacterium]|nr:hypothetical protein [Verrucomicrobiales bacterium]